MRQINHSRWLRYFLVVGVLFCLNTSLINALVGSYSPFINSSQINTTNVSMNGSINFLGDGSGIRSLMYLQSGVDGPPIGDGFRINYIYDFELINDDWLIFNKVDGNDLQPDGGIGFVMTGNTNINHTIMKLDGYQTVHINNTLQVPNVNATNINATKMNVSNTFDVYGQATFWDNVTMKKNLTINGNQILRGNLSFTSSNSNITNLRSINTQSIDFNDQTGLNIMTFNLNSQVASIKGNLQLNQGTGQNGILDIRGGGDTADSIWFYDDCSGPCVYSHIGGSDGWFNMLASDGIRATIDPFFVTRYFSVTPSGNLYLGGTHTLDDGTNTVAIANICTAANGECNFTQTTLNNYWNQGVNTTSNVQFVNETLTGNLTVTQSIFSKDLNITRNSRFVGNMSMPGPNQTMRWTNGTTTLAELGLYNTNQVSYYMALDPGVYNDTYLKIGDTSANQNPAQMKDMLASVHIQTRKDQQTRSGLFVTDLNFEGTSSVDHYSINAFIYPGGGGDGVDTPFSNLTGLIIANRCEVRNTRTTNNNISTAAGVSGAIVGQSTGTGRITNATGVWAYPNNANKGIIENSFAFKGDAATVGTGSITNAYGMFLEKQTRGGTINNEIFLQSTGGIFFNDQTSSISTNATGYVNINATQVTINAKVNLTGTKAGFALCINSAGNIGQCTSLVALDGSCTCT